MCEKTCEDKQPFYKGPIFWGIIAIVAATMIVIFLVWVILQPHNPIFVLQDLTITQLSLSSSNLLTSNIQLTLSTNNPNQRVSIYYEKLAIFASYRNQQVTSATELPRSYLGHRDETIWSPSLYGDSVALDPYLGAALNEDISAGTILVNIKVDGILKWKVGSLTTAKYQINVNCPAFMTFGNGHGVANKYQLFQDCPVEVAVN